MKPETDTEPLTEQPVKSWVPEIIQAVVAITMIVAYVLLVAWHLPPDGLSVAVPAIVLVYFVQAGTRSSVRVARGIEREQRVRKTDPPKDEPKG